MSLARTIAVVAAPFIAVDPVAAVPVSTSLVFAEPDVNPWTGGPAFVKTKAERLDIPRVGADYPAARIGLLGPVGGFLGFDLLSASAGLTGGARGALEVGYHVNGGRLNLMYPAQASIDVKTLGGGGALSVFESAATATSFSPGLEKLVVVPAIMPSIAGDGWARMRFRESADPLLDIVTFIDRPRFQTEFPNAAAWAQLNYTVDVAAYVKATAISFLGFDFGVRRNFGTSFNDSLRLVDINPGGIQFLEEARVPVFNYDYAVGPATFRTNYPDPKVHARQSGSNPNFGGSDIQSVVEIRGALEQLLPVVGNFLSVGWGPFKATLLEVDGGPTFSVYQDMKLDVAPTVTLLFDRAVSWTRDGVRRLVTRIDALAGETIDWSPILGSSATVSVQPVYNLGAHFRNETGLAVGYVLDIDALQLTSPLSLGPLDLYYRNQPDLLRIPFFNERFPIATDAMPGTIQTFDVTIATLFASGLQNRSVVIDSFTNLGSGFWSLGIRDVLTGATARPSLQGEAFEFGGDIFLRSLEGNVNFDFLVPGLGAGQAFLGDLFCLSCRWAGDQFLALGPSLLDDAGERVYVASLFDHVTPEICSEGGYGCDPELNRVAEHVRTDERYYIGPVETPAPSAWTLLPTGLAVALAVRRRRAHA